jgi:hypothetical protein
MAVAAGAIVAGSAQGGQAAADSSAIRCSPTRVHHEPNPALGSLSGGRWIAARPFASRFVGYLWGGEEVGGRFALYAGGRNPVSGTSEKVLWIAPQDAPVGASLRLTGQRLRFNPRLRRYEPIRGSFTQRFGAASSDQMPEQLFPSIVDVPRAGCWRLTLRTGRIYAVVVALVQPARPH